MPKADSAYGYKNSLHVFLYRIKEADLLFSVFGIFFVEEDTVMEKGKSKCSPLLSGLGSDAIVVRSIAARNSVHLEVTGSRLTKRDLYNSQFRLTLSRIVISVLLHFNQVIHLNVGSLKVVASILVENQFVLQLLAVHTAGNLLRSTVQDECRNFELISLIIDCGTSASTGRIRLPGGSNTLCKVSLVRPSPSLSWRMIQPDIGKSTALELFLF